MKKVFGWSSYETIGISIVNFNFGKYSYDVAKSLIEEGVMRWAMCQGCCLSLVPIDYELKDFEYFVQNTEKNIFEKEGA